MIRITLGLTLLAFALSMQANAGGLYVSGSFGVNYDEDPPFAFISEDTGLVGAVALGTSIASVDGLRVELEASFRTHDSNIGPITLTHDTTAVMMNAVYDAKGLAIGNVVPYLLLGGGAAWTDLTIGGLGLLTIENSGMAYQAGFGFTYEVSEDVGLGLGYRYLEAPALEIFGFELDGGGNHAVMATATVKLN